jgi:predicted permease
MRINLPNAAYKTPAQITSLFNRLLERVAALPGVRQTGAISDLPMSSSSNVLLSAEGHATQTERTDTLFCLGNALGVLRVKLLKGRLLEPEDYAGKAHAAVISEGLAKRFWPAENPIGRHVKFGVDDPMNGEPWLAVVGVVADVKAKLTSNSPRIALFTTPVDLVNAMDVIVRTSGKPAAVAGALRHQIGQIDPNLAVDRIETITEVLSDSLSAESFRTWLLTCFAGAAMLLATLGIGGLLTYDAARRKQEFGIRVAVGASRRHLFELVLRHCLRLAGAGVFIGLVTALLVNRAIAALLYETSPFDPATFAAVCFALALFALGASLIPALRVVRLNPITSLRGE